MKKYSNNPKRFKKSKKHIFVIPTVFIVLCIVIYFSLEHITPSQNSPISIRQQSSPQAAIVDQLSIFLPNETFTQEAITILENAGFAVDYYKGEDVTVEFYRELPQKGYSFIIMRAHSGIEYMGNKTTGNVDIFTSERYNENEASGKYFWEAIDNRLVRVFFTEGGLDYFGISPKFVESSMVGRFENATIIMMGCDGLRPGYTTLAEAFIKKGAKVYVGWTGPVTSTHTDAATIHLLQAFLLEKQTIKNAIITTMNNVGPDPAFRSELLYYS